MATVTVVTKGTATNHVLVGRKESDHAIRDDGGELNQDIAIVTDDGYGREREGGRKREAE